MTDRDCANPQYRKCVMLDGKCKNCTQDLPDCGNSQFRKCILVDGKCKNCGGIEGQPQPCANCGGDCYPTCEEITESGLSARAYRRRENKEWLREMRDEEFGMGFQEG